MTRDENNWQRLSGDQLLLEFEAAGTRKLQVQDQACGGIGLFGFQKLRSRSKDSHSKSRGGNEAGQRFPYPMIVIHHEDNGAVGVHDATPAWTGRVKEKLVLGPSPDVAHSRP